MPLSNYKAVDFSKAERKYLSYRVNVVTLRALGMLDEVIDQIKTELFTTHIRERYPATFLRNNRIMEMIPIPNNGRPEPLRFITTTNYADDTARMVERIQAELPRDAVITANQRIPNAVIADHGYRDLAHYYSGCFGIHVVNGEAKVFYCDGFRDEDDGVSIAYRYIDNGQVQGINRSSFTDEFSFPLPKTGYFNLDKFTIFSERSYKKDNSTKYKKGFCHNHLTYTSVSINEIYQSKLADNHNPHDYPLQDYVFKVAESVLVNTLPSFQEALNKVTSFEMLSCAFTSTLCIKLDAMYNRFVLLKNTWTIGEYNLETKRFIMFTPIFNNELRNLNIEYEDAL